MCQGAGRLPGRAQTPLPSAPDSYQTIDNDGTLCYDESYAAEDMDAVILIARGYVAAFSGGSRKPKGGYKTMATRQRNERRHGQARQVIEFLQKSNLVNLDRPVSEVVGAVSTIADDIDGHLICWRAYVLIHRLDFGEELGVITEETLGG
jgi:hypothetical protein